MIPFCTHDGYGAERSWRRARTPWRDSPSTPRRSPPAKERVRQWLDSPDLEGGQGETAIRITGGDTALEGVLYDSGMARQFLAQLPQTVSMSNYGGREVYGGIRQEITVEGEGQLRFEDGDITCCPANNTAAIFYGQSARPELTMRVYPIGKVTSGLSVFPGLPGRVDVAFEVMKEVSKP